MSTIASAAVGTGAQQQQPVDGSHNWQDSQHQQSAWVAASASSQPQPQQPQPVPPVSNSNVVVQQQQSASPSPSTYAGAAASGLQSSHSNNSQNTNVAPPPQPQMIQPVEWKEYVVPETGEKYYHNNRTGKTQWERPADLGW